jgi:hypothetical protein
MEILSLNNWIYFTAPHPDYGVELFKVEFSKQDQQITFDPISNKTFGDASFTIVASASSGLPVQMTSGQELSITGQTATVVNPGTVSVTVKQAGDALFNAAEAVQTFCVLPAKPTVETIFLQEGGVVLTSNASSGNQWYKDNIAIAATDYTMSPAESGAYKVNVTVDGCTSEFSDEHDIIITGIEPIEDHVSFYPNPAREVLTIKADGATTQVNILNIQGASMDNFTLKGNDVVDHSLDGYPNGVYIIKFITTNGSVHQKFVKE